MKVGAQPLARPRTPSSATVTCTKTFLNKPFIPTLSYSLNVMKFIKINRNERNTLKPLTMDLYLAGSV